jgi:hypothetical protein
MAQEGRPIRCSERSAVRQEIQRLKYAGFATTVRTYNASVTASEKQLRRGNISKLVKVQALNHL